MIYWFKPLPEKDLENKELFSPIKNQWLTKNYESVCSILNMACMIIFFYLLNGERYLIRNIALIFPNLPSRFAAILVSLTFFASIIVVHEFLHMIVVLGKGDMSIVVKLSSVSVCSDAELSKMRNIVLYSLPIFVLTVIPFALSFFLPNNISVILRLISLVNLGLSSSDTIMTINYIFSAPKNAIFWRGWYYMPTSNNEECTER